MADNYYYCFTHSNSLGTDTQLAEKLQDLSQAAASNPPRGIKGRCMGSAHDSVLECVVSESYICLLLEEGQICRVAYSEEQPKEKSEEATPSHASRSASPKSELDDFGRVPSSSLSWGMVLGDAGGGLGAGSSYASGVSRLASRSRMLLRRRGGGRSLGSRWPLVPAADVPDPLINQAMAVLQGKSRDAVIRELQRTNLDVNQAVNNLLSRDDDDGDGEGSEGDPLVPAAFFPSGDELLSLLGSVGAVGGEDDLEDGRPPRGEAGREEGTREELAGRLSRAVLDELGSEPILVPSEVVSLREAGGGRREEGKRRKIGGGGKPAKKEVVPTPVFHDTEIPLQGGAAPTCFKHIAGLHSELVAVDSEGLVWRWAWQSGGIEPHPLVNELGLAEERVKFLSGRQLRVSVVTETGKVASWLDSSVASVVNVVEMSAHLPSELLGEAITQLHSSNLFSAILTASNKIYWWGMFPFAERKQAVMDVQETLRGTSRYSAAETDIKQHSLVCLRSSPIYTAGTKAIYCKGHKLQCGILEESVFSSSMSEKCRFSVMKGSKVAGGTGEPGEQGEGRETSNLAPPQLGTKRRYTDEGSGGREELWSLHDVIFTDRVQSVRMGRVLKVDGHYAAVHFPVKGEGVRGEGEGREEVRREGEEKEEPMEEGEGAELLEKCRLLRKDDLVPATELLTQQVPHYRQDNLHRLRGPSPSDTALVVCCGAQGVHALFSSRHQMHHITFNLSGRVVQSATFSELSSHYFLHQATPIQLLPMATNQWLIRDKLGGVHLTSVNAASAMKDPAPQNLPPVTAMATGQCSSRTSAVVVAWRRQSLIPVLLRKDVTALKSLLASTGKEEIESLLLEHTSGGCNILHVLSILGRPPVPSRSPSPYSGMEHRSMAARTTPRSGVLREIMKQAMALASSSAPPHGLDPPDPAPWASDEGESDSSPPPPAASSVSPSIVSLCLEQLSLLLTQHPSPLISLLGERNIEGHTPFMAAVYYKAYSVALQLLDLALSVSNGDQTRLLAALYPSDCHPDDNPVFVLCRNDNCSFTWTGELHIHQDIFVCRSCGLTDSLCCCTECAYSCHRGHDCVFKKASPTAYCDCWERCSCKCLAQTPDATRLSLLHKLMATTSLANKLDSSHQSVLAVLLTIVAHQSRAQSHWSAIRSSALHSRSRHEDTPVHNLRPPKFAPKALTVVVEDWQCVKSAILCGSGGGATAVDHTHQLGSVPLDAMVYQLLAKHSGQETLHGLLSTLVKHINQDDDAVGVALCFLRSVVRVWSVCDLETTNLPTSSLSTSRRHNESKSGVSERAFFVFSSLAIHSIPVLLDTALSVITPVTRGMARPVDPLCMTDRHRVAEEMFRLPPVTLLREHHVEDGDHSEGVSGDESETGDGEESVTGAVAHDASSTATIGSNLLYLSDEQDSSDNEELDSADDASLPGDYRHDDDVILDQAPPQRVHASVVGSHWALPSLPPPPTTPTSSGSRFSRSSRRSARSVGTSSSLLAQSFSLIVRQIAVVLETTFDIRNCPVPSFQLPVSTADPKALAEQVWVRLDPVWVWLVNNLDSVEVQIRHGNDVSQKAPFKNHGRGKIGDAGSSDALEGRREAFSYLLTLLRGGGTEAQGLIPAIDVAGMEHLAWTLDALHYLLETTRPSCQAKELSALTSSSILSQPQTSIFFRRSRSTSCLGALPASPFDPLHEALPLAEKPHLLDSSYNKQQLFGFNQASVLEVWPSCDLQPPPILPLISAPLPGGQRSTSTLGKVPTKHTDPAHLGVCRMVGVNSHELTASVLLGRWASTVDLFGRVFGETVGRLPGSYLAQERGFETREREFRRDMDAVHSSTHSELTLQVERSRDKLLLGVVQQLQSVYDSRHTMTTSTSNPPLCVYRTKVVFENEPGEGSGVLRSLFTAFSEAVLSEEALPRLEGLARPRKGSLSYPSGSAGFKGKSSRDRVKTSRSASIATSQPSVIKHSGRVPAPEVEPALFYQPGKAGFYSLVQATPTVERLQMFRGVGRMIGLGLLLAEVFPLPLCRHILKFIMTKEVAWHDLAFFDPAIYESLRKVIVESQGEGGRERMANMGLTFQVSLRPEEGGESCELVPGGAAQAVTPDNVYQYVKLYAELRMVGVCQEALLSMRQGVYDVIPEGALCSLSAEDLRLILCGCHSIDTDRLRAVTVFEDESKKEEEVLTRFKVWFWSVVERMNVRERQELLYFWTSSPALPANTESYQPSPSITIRPPDDSRLPTANTCISRLYLPLYSSRSLLRTRLLTALKTKTFGFV